MSIVITPRTLKGFRDFLPAEERRRLFVMRTLERVFCSYGFEPLETPVLEYEDILAGKYGEEGERLMYRFVDQGKRNVAMRYDQTVPLARVVAQYQNDLPLPFKRYQIQNVWRAENTQKGRYREFIQCDIDIVGTTTPLSDSEIIVIAAKCLTALGFTQYAILVNDRRVFSMLIQKGLVTESEMNFAVVAVDKLKKVGRDGVIQELVQKGIAPQRAETILDLIQKQEKTDSLNDIHTALADFPDIQNRCKFDPTLARGLSYYTGLIFEIEVEGFTGSVCGGGRYDNLIGMFTKTQIPSVGLSFGFDRVIEAMNTLSLFPTSVDQATARVLISIFSGQLQPESVKIADLLREKGINTELYMGEIKEKNPLEKQLKYADQKNIPFMVIIGPKEKEMNLVALKNLQTKEQKTLSLEELVEETIETSSKI